MVRIARVLVGCVLAALATHVAAQAFPAKPFRLIVPVVPGGSADSVARITADRFRDVFAQTAVVENRPGTNEVQAMETVARAAPDGYTLLVQSGTHVILPFVDPQLPVEPMKAFAPIGPLTRVPFALLIHPSVPVKSVTEFIAFAKARPGQLDFASAGVASGSRLAGEIFNMLAGVRMVNIPYKGAGQAVSDLVGGHVQVAFNSPNVAVPLLKAGRLRALAISGESRFTLMPDVPTFAQAGFSSFNEFGWQGLFAAAATPRSVIDRLSAEIIRMQAAADLKAVYERQGLDTFVLTPDQFAAFLKTESAKLDKVIKTGNIKFTPQ